jgi:hypothetical protein
MPHLPDHTTHDPEPIAAYAAGDATGDELALATELVDDCPECAALHHDLRAIAAALPSLPAPVRPRDFRLTPEQAERLRPRGWARLREALAGPRFAFAQPLGAGLATLGIAGLLLVAISGAPLAPSPGSGSSGASAVPQAPGTVERPADNRGSVGTAGAEAANGASPPAVRYPDRSLSSPAASAGYLVAVPAPTAAPSEAPSQGLDAGHPAASAAPVEAGPKTSAAPELRPAAQGDQSQQVLVAPGAGAQTQQLQAAERAGEAPLLAAAAALLALVGFGLVALRWVARRSA